MKKAVENLAITYLKNTDDVIVDCGNGIIQDDLREIGVIENLNELAKEVEEYCKENAKLFGKEFINRQAYSNLDNILIAKKGPM